MTVSKFIEQILQEKKKRGELPEDYEKFVETLAIAIADALDGDVKEYFNQFLQKLDSIDARLYTLRLCLQPVHWYHILWVTAELTPYITKQGFNLSVDVSANSTYTYNLDLTGTQWCCVCPVLIACSQIGPNYSTLTVLVNEPPVDVKEPDWINVYVCQNRPLPSDIYTSLQTGFLYTFAPKRKVKITFGNSYTQAGRFTYFADYLQMTKDKGQDLIANCYIPFKERVIEKIVGGK